MVRSLVLFCTLATLSGLHAQEWAYWYAPQSAAEVRDDGRAYKGYSGFSNDGDGSKQYLLNTGLWGRFNTASNTPGIWGCKKPLEVYTCVNNRWNRSWRVSWNVVGEMASWSPYRVPEKGYNEWVKGFPNIRVEGHPKFGTAGEWWHGMWVDWGFGVQSGDWSASKFNVILEIRQWNPRMGEYIIQIELMNRGFGSPKSPNTYIEGHHWSYECFETVGPVGPVPVYKFMYSGAPVKGEAWRRFGMNLRPFMVHVANNPYKFGDWRLNRGAWDARTFKVSAGVEIRNGVGNHFHTTDYALYVW